MIVEKTKPIIENKPNIHKVLLMGYNGANNTGSEARLLTIIEDVRKVLGEDIEITIPTMFSDNLRRYIKEGPKLKIAEYPPVYFLTLRRLVREHDLILLTEGSCYMDTWSFYLLWAFLWVSWCGFKNSIPVVAYAVDSGSLSALNRMLVQKVASKTDLIITRTQASADRLKAGKISAPIAVTADCAFDFHTDPDDNDLLKRIWPKAASGTIGIAAVDFYLWPVVFRLWGRRKNCYRWPFYYSDSRERRVARETMAENYARFADRTIEKHGRPITFICMEELDESFARLIQSSMRHKDETRIFSSREYNASQITAILRSLDLLITSRYHAGVLSLDAAVPQVAMGHDQRLRDLYRDLGIYDQYFLEHSSPQLFQLLDERVESLLQNPACQQIILRKNSQIQQMRSKYNIDLLAEFITQTAWIRTKAKRNPQPKEVIS
ncbi:polysaccharide pyruvyl transferase family protein [Acetivibrio cellulolyticus]|uniref:polysaccharide pyruvyl transferase family protein n=1 Tax=Acetivibrio cellulolyticus TaxID=35830 RepID=UPI0001E2CC5D|nr:polysaccharide pyruvyl transferase family protein [Acetivibrio cellulolyticus]